MDELVVYTVEIELEYIFGDASILSRLLVSSTHRMRSMMLKKSTGIVRTNMLTTAEN